MSRSLFSNLYKQNGSLRFHGDSTTTTNTFTFTPLCFLKTPFRPISDNPTAPTHHNSFTISYLVNSCGLSEEKAILVSKKLQLESSSKPDSVLTLFRQHEFSNTHISTIIKKHPLVLRAKADKTLKPKLEFFASLGLSGLNLANLVSKDPQLLTLSLEERIIPSIAFLRSIVLTEANVVTVFKRSTWILRQDPRKRLAPNITLLRTHGVPEHNISKLLVSNARTLVRGDRFNEIVEEIKKMKFDPSKEMFIRAIQMLSCLSKSSWEAKFDIYKRWGWSKDEILMAFRKQPQCMTLSEKNIMDTMDFLVNKMSCDPLLIAKTPTLLMYSLKKRIIPRLSVIQVLISNGFIGKDCSIYSALQQNDEKFVKKFVTRFEEKVPELLNTYKKKMEDYVSTH